MITKINHLFYVILYNYILIPGLIFSNEVLQYRVSYYLEFCIAKDLCINLSALPPKDSRMY